MLLVSLVLFTGVLAIYVRYRHYRYYPLFKIVPLILLLWAFARPSMNDEERLIFLGLMAGLMGDVLLTFPRYFTAGLGAFLLGHISYIVAFYEASIHWVWLSFLIPWVIVMSVVLIRSLMQQGRAWMSLPVFVYVLVSAAMILLAAGQDGDRAGLLLPAALLFGFSDAVLAINRFVKPFALAQVIILITYYLAQALIAVSYGAKF
ncbi:MAG: lysoplasmalogenase [Spirochaetales bacterium]|nr:lysoplasmalogenase [Spirochaetales bacterium]